MRRRAGSMKGSRGGAWEDVLGADASHFLDLHVPDLRLEQCVRYVDGFAW